MRLFRLFVFSLKSGLLPRALCDRVDCYCWHYVWLLSFCFSVPVAEVADIVLAVVLFFRPGVSRTNSCISHASFSSLSFFQTFVITGCFVYLCCCVCCSVCAFCFICLRLASSGGHFGMRVVGQVAWRDTASAIACFWWLRGMLEGNAKC